MAPRSERPRAPPPAAEASKRFDKGLDRRNCPRGPAERAVALLRELSGASSVGDMTDIRLPASAQRRVDSDRDDIERLIGYRYPDSQIEEILSRLGVLTSNGKAGDSKSSYRRGATTWRGKLTLPKKLRDIVGYDVIPAELPSESCPRPRKNPPESGKRLRGARWPPRPPGGHDLFARGSARGSTNGRRQLLSKRRARRGFDPHSESPEQRAQPTSPDTSPKSAQHARLANLRHEERVSNV